MQSVHITKMAHKKDTATFDWNNLPHEVLSHMVADWTPAQRVHFAAVNRSTNAVVHELTKELYVQADAERYPDLRQYPHLETLKLIISSRKKHYSPFEIVTIEKLRQCHADEVGPNVRFSMIIHAQDNNSRIGFIEPWMSMFLKRSGFVPHLSDFQLLNFRSLHVIDSNKEYDLPRLPLSRLHVTDKMVLDVTAAHIVFAGLKWLKLESVTYDMMQAIEQLAEMDTFQNLEVMDVCAVEIEDDEHSEIRLQGRHFKRLEKLFISEFVVHDIAFVNSFPSLETLRLDNCYHEIHASGDIRLDHLEIRSTAFEDDTFNLRGVDVKTLIIEDVVYSSPHLANLENMPRLQRLHLRGCVVHPNEIVMCKTLKEVELIDVQYYLQPDLERFYVDLFDRDSPPDSLTLGTFDDLEMDSEVHHHHYKDAQTRSLIKIMDSLRRNHNVCELRRPDMPLVMRRVHDSDVFEHVQTIEMCLV